MRENSKKIFEEGRGEDRGKRKMEKGKMGRIMRRGKYKVLRKEWAEEEEKFALLPPPTTSEAPPRLLLTRSQGWLRRFGMAVVELFRSAAASIAGCLDVIPVDIIGPANRRTDTSDEDDNNFDEAKCVVGASRTYCRNCRRYHHALVPQI